MRQLLGALYGALFSELESNCQSTHVQLSLYSVDAWLCRYVIRPVDMLLAEL